MKKGNFRRRKFNKKRKNTYKIFFLVLVGMTVGFAAINTTLQLIGTLNIARTTWNIEWENPTKTGGVTATTDVHLKQNDNTTVEYQVALANPGDYYEFTVDAKNNGTIDAMITGIDNKVYENNVVVTKPDYLDFIVTYGDGKTIANNHLLKAGKKETYKVKVMYKTGLYANELPTSTRNLKFTFTVTYMQADENTSVNRLWTLPAGKNKNNLEVGDEICLSDQCFNFLKYDGTNNENIVMLSKWNLKIGMIVDSDGNQRGRYSESDPGYGLQSSEARGVVSGETRYGTVAYSATNYWDDNGSPSSNYPGSYSRPNYPTVYDPINYKVAPDFSTLPICDSSHCYNTPGYSIAYYVEEYKTKLTNDYGQTIKNARLLTYVEATDASIGCANDRCPTNEFITETSFWLGSAGEQEGIWTVYTKGSFYKNPHTHDGFFGIRPVIVIDKANI